jgi:hypothetical protein
MSFPRERGKRLLAELSSVGLIARSFLFFQIAAFSHFGLLHQHNKMLLSSGDRIPELKKSVTAIELKA